MLQIVLFFLFLLESQTKQHFIHENNGLKRVNRLHSILSWMVKYGFDPDCVSVCNKDRSGGSQP